MQRLRRWANKVLKYAGVVVLDTCVVDDLIAMTICQRVALTSFLEPGQMVIWDSEAKTINIVMRH